MSDRVGSCFHGFVRCIGNRTDEPDRARYRTTQIESIKFENLLTLEEREKATRLPLVTESELQYVREGRLDKLAEDQIRRDMERDEELRREEERLKREENAYYAAKKEAAKRTKLNPTKETITSQPRPTVDTRSRTYAKLKEDEEDFDQFLENVKSISLSTTGNTSPRTTHKLHSITSDSSSEEEIDFGYWESASLPTMGSDSYKGDTNGIRTEGNLKEVDLNLL